MTSTFFSSICTPLMLSSALRASSVRASILNVATLSLGNSPFNVAILPFTISICASYSFHPWVSVADFWAFCKSLNCFSRDVTLPSGSISCLVVVLGVLGVFTLFASDNAFFRRSISALSAFVSSVSVVDVVGVPPFSPIKLPTPTPMLSAAPLIPPSFTS